MPQQATTGPKLADVFTPEEIVELRNELVPSSQATPVRFQFQGQTVILETGDLQGKGINVMYQHVYWNFTRETARKIAAAMQLNPVFSQ